MKSHTDEADNQGYIPLISRLLKIIEKIDDGGDIAPECPIDYIATLGTLRKDYLLAKDVLAIIEKGTGLGAEAIGRVIVEDMIFLRYLKSQTSQDVKERFQHHPAVQHYQMFVEAKELGIDLGDDSKYKERFEKHERLFRRPDGTYWNNWACKKLTDIVEAIVKSDSSGGAKSMMPMVMSAYDDGSEVIHHNASLITILNIAEGFKKLGTLRAFNGLRDTFLALTDTIEIAINEQRQRFNDSNAFSTELDELNAMVQEYIGEQQDINESLEGH